MDDDDSQTDPLPVHDSDCDHHVRFSWLRVSYFTLVFGELVPKQVAMRKAEPLSGLLSKIAAVFRPIVWLLTASTNSILRLMGIEP